MENTLSIDQFHSTEFPSMVSLPAARELPQEALLCFNQGIEHMQCGDAPAAVAALAQCLEHAPACSDAHVFMGIANALNYNIYPAIDHLERAQQLEPASFAAHYTLAQLHFKLRIPRKGYEAAEQALRCVQTMEQRKMLAQLLREERARAGSGVARPWFNKPFGRPIFWVMASGMAAVLIAALVHIH